jgi:glutamyl-Q tRNA(Asp) synthetase
MPVDIREPSRYVGRFAPSPTGSLHFGSLLAALASYLEARTRHGRWFVRIEDIDPPRERPGAADSILDTLEKYGFSADDPPVWQSASAPFHSAAVTALLDADLAYNCDCSRKDIGESEPGAPGPVYPGTCRFRRLANGTNRAIRVRCDGTRIGFDDRLQGRSEQELDITSGDFVVWRRDGLPAYQLAVVVDDHQQGVTDVVRGVDLLDSTPRQIWLQRQLGYPTPTYAHIPVAVDVEGRKLSKASQAAALPVNRPVPVLHRALAVLGQSPPPELTRAPLVEIWNWALAHWNLGRVAGHAVAQVVQPLW